MFKAILFDLDGVLIETELETFKFYQQILKNEYSIDLPDEYFKYKAGRKSADFWNDALSQEDREKVDVQNLTQRKRNAFNTDPGKYIKAVSGGKTLLEQLQKGGYRLALASQNERRMIETVLDWLEIKSYFEYILSIDDIQNLKPDPEIYLQAAKLLECTPDECCVIEDSKDGIGAAKNANMYCIALRHAHSPAENLIRADQVVDQLSQINLKEKRPTDAQ